MHPPRRDRTGPPGECCRLCWKTDSVEGNPGSEQGAAARACACTEMRRMLLTMFSGNCYIQKVPRVHSGLPVRGRLSVVLCLRSDLRRSWLSFRDIRFRIVRSGSFLAEMLREHPDVGLCEAK